MYNNKPIVEESAEELNFGFAQALSQAILKLGFFGNAYHIDIVSPVPALELGQLNTLHIILRKFQKNNVNLSTKM